MIDQMPNPCYCPYPQVSERATQGCSNFIKELLLRSGSKGKNMPAGCNGRRSNTSATGSLWFSYAPSKAFQRTELST